jgi:hypothetical protein
MINEFMMNTWLIESNTYFVLRDLWPCALVTIHAQMVLFPVCQVLLNGQSHWYQHFYDADTTTHRVLIQRDHKIDSSVSRWHKDDLNVRMSLISPHKAFKILNPEARMEMVTIPDRDVSGWLGTEFLIVGTERQYGY